MAEQKQEAQTEEKEPNATAIFNVGALADLVMGYAPNAEIVHVTGHSGTGFYLYCSEYPEDGSTFLGNDASDVAAIAAELANRLYAATEKDS